VQPPCAAARRVPAPAGPAGSAAAVPPPPPAPCPPQRRAGWRLRAGGTGGRRSSCLRRQARWEEPSCMGWASAGARRLLPNTHTAASMLARYVAAASSHLRCAQGSPPRRRQTHQRPPLPQPPDPRCSSRQTTAMLLATNGPAPQGSMTVRCRRQESAAATWVQGSPRRLSLAQAGAEGFTTACCSRVGCAQHAQISPPRRRPPTRAVAAPVPHQVQRQQQHIAFLQVLAAALPHALQPCRNEGTGACLETSGHGSAGRRQQAGTRVQHRALQRGAARLRERRARGGSQPRLQLLQGAGRKDEPGAGGGPVQRQGFSETLRHGTASSAGVARRER
jgi:hypothetical protein